MAYFYCSGKIGQSQARGTDPAIVFRSLVRQFAWTGEGDIASNVTGKYKRMVEERPRGSAFSIEESSDILIQLINALPDTTIIIDALDECTLPYKLLRALQRIRNDTVGHMRLLVSGRNHIDVSSIIEECERTDLAVISDVMDIRSFIEKEVKYGENRLLRGTEPALEDRLIETLRTHAQGK